MSDISDLVKQIIVPQQSDSFTNSTEIDYTDHDSISQLTSQILVPEQPPTPVERNPLMDIPTAIIAGTTDLAEMFARGYRGGDIPGSETETIEGQRDPLNQFANWLIQNKDTFEKKHPYIYAPAEGEGTVRKWFREGARAVVPSLGASVPAAIAGGSVGGIPGAIIGYAGGGATIFGRAEYDRFIQDVQKYNTEHPDKAIPPEVYMDKAFESAVLEGGLEGLNDLIEAATFKVGGLLTKPMKSTIKEILNMGMKEGTKSYLKMQAVLQPSEMLTEAGQEYYETALRNNLGIDDTDPKDAALAALGPTFFSTLIMSSGAHALNVRQNSKIAKALENPETDFDARFNAMRTIYKELQKQDKVNNTSFANTWGKVAQYKLLNNEAININEALSEVKPLETILKDKAVTNSLNEDVAKFDERGKEKPVIEDIDTERPETDKTITPTGHTLETRQIIYNSLINKGFGEERANELASKIMGAKEAPVAPTTKVVNTEILDEFGKNIQKEVPLDSTNETIKLTPGESILSNIPEGLRNQFVYKQSGGLFSGPGNVKAILKKQGLNKEYGPLLIAPGEWIGAPLSLIQMIDTMKGVSGKTIPQIITPVNTKSTERTEIPEADYNKVQRDDLSNKGIPFTNKISAQRAIIRQQKQFNAPEDFYEIVNIGDKQFVARPKKLVKAPVKIETARDIINRRNPEYLAAVKVSDQDGIKKLDEIIQNLKDEGHENTPAYKQTVQRRDIIARRIAREEKRRAKEVKPTKTTGIAIGPLLTKFRKAILGKTISHATTKIKYGQILANGFTSKYNYFSLGEEGWSDKENRTENISIIVNDELASRIFPDPEGLLDAEEIGKEFVHFGDVDGKPELYEKTLEHALSEYTGDEAILGDGNFVIKGKISPDNIVNNKVKGFGNIATQQLPFKESQAEGTEVQGQGKKKNVVAFVNPKQFVTELYSFAQGLFNGKSTQEDYDTLLDKYNFTDDAFISTDDSLMDAGYTSNWYVDPNKVYKLLVNTFKVKPDIARSLIDQYNWVPDVNKELNEIDEVRKDIRKKESGLTIVQGQGKAKQAVENLKAKVKEKEEQVKEKSIKDRLTARLITARLKLGENVSDETVAKFKTVALRWSRNPETGKWEEHEPAYKRLMTEEEREKKEDIRNVLKAEAKGREQKTETQTKTTKEKAVDITKSQLFTPIEETKLNLDNFTVLEPALDRRMLRKMAPVNFPNAFRAMINHAIQVNDGTIDFVMIENFINQLETASKAGKLNSSFDTNVDKQLFDKRLGLVKTHLEQARDYISKHQKEMAKKREQAILDRKAQRAAEIEEGIKPLEEEDNEPLGRKNNNLLNEAVKQFGKTVNPISANGKYLMPNGEFLGSDETFHHGDISSLIDSFKIKHKKSAYIENIFMKHTGCARWYYKSGPDMYGENIVIDIDSTTGLTYAQLQVIDDLLKTNNKANIIWSITDANSDKQLFGGEDIHSRGLRKALAYIDKLPFARSSEPNSTKTLSLVDVQKIINSFSKVWINQPNTIVVKDRAELLTIADETLEQYIKETPDHVRIGGVLHHDTIFLIADELINRDDVIKTMLHEMIGHYGVAKTLGPEFDKVCADIFNKFKDTPLMEKLIQDYNHYNPSEREGQQGLGAEFIAKMAEDKAYNPTFWEYLIQEVKRILNKMFGTEFQLPDNQIRALIMESNKFIEGKKDYGKVEDYFQTPVRGNQESPVPWAYSALLKGVQDNLKSMPAKVQSLRKWLEKFAKPAELKWMGVEQFFGNKVIINKDEFLKFLKDNQIGLEEILRDSNYKIKAENLPIVLTDTQRYAIEMFNNGAVLISRDANGTYHSYDYETYESDGQWFAVIIKDGDELYTIDDFFDDEDEAEEAGFEEVMNLDLGEDEVSIDPHLLHETEDINNKRYPTKWSGHQAVKGGEDYQEMQFIWNPSKPLPLKEVLAQGGRPSDVNEHFYASDHWVERNVIGHTRWSTFVDSLKRKIMVIQEIQSDWLQDAKVKGFKQTKGDGVALAPFLENWHEVFMKRMIRYAAENGFDGIAWSTGEQQIKLYESALRKHVKEIRWSTINGTKKVGVREHTGGENVLYVNSDGIITDGFRGTEGHNIVEVIGKELAIKIMSQDKGSLSGLDLKIGGKGMNVFYDEKLKNFTNKYIKQWKAKLETINLGEQKNTTQDWRWETMDDGEYSLMTEDELFRIEHDKNKIHYSLFVGEIGDNDEIHLGNFRTLTEAKDKALAYYNYEHPAVTTRPTLNQPGFYLTPEMKHDVIYKGQPLWNKQGIDQTKLLQDIEQKFDTTSGFVYGAGILLPNGNSLSSTKMHEDLIYDIQQQIPELKSKDMGTILKLLKGIRTRAYGKDNLYAEIPLGVKPTEAQYSTIERALNKETGSLTYDIVNESNQTIMSSGVVNTIDEFKRIFTGQGMSDVARWHKMGDVYGRRVSKNKAKEMINDLVEYYGNEPFKPIFTKFILPDGKIIGNSDNQDIQHFEAAEDILMMHDITIGEDDDPFEQTNILMDFTGIIRVGSGGDFITDKAPLGLEFSSKHKPTEAQFTAIQELLSYSNGKIAYDISDMGGAKGPSRKSGIVNSLTALKQIFKGKQPSLVAQFHEPMGRRIVDFQGITNDTSKQELKDLFNDEAYALLKTLSMQLPKNLPALTWAERYLLSPEFYSHPTMEKIVKAAIERHDRYYEIFNELNNVDHQFNGEDNIIDLNIKLKHKGLTKVQIIKGDTSEDYKKFEKMKDEIDTGEWRHNYSDNDKTTWEQHYRLQGTPDDVIELYKLHRDAYDKALNLLITPMQTLVTEIERVAKRDNTKPKYPTFTTLDEQGQPIQISLKEVIDRMGQLRGTYAPRIREVGNYVIKGKRFNKVVRYHKPNRLEAELLKRELERKGYKVEDIHERERLPEDVYASLRIINTQKAIETAMKGMHEKELDTELLAKFNEELIRNVADLVRMRGFRSSMITRGKGEVVRGYITDPNERFVRYINNIAAGIAKGEAAKKMFGLIAGEYQGEGKDRKKVGGIDPSTEYRVYETATKYIEEQLRNTDTGDRIIGMVKSIATFKYLGLNLRSPVVNVLALVTTVPMAIHTHAMEGKGSMIIIGKELAKAAKDYVDIMRGKKLTNKNEQAYVDEIKRKGYDTPQYTREALGTIERMSGKAWAKTMYWSMYIFGKSEQWIRGTTMLAAYRLLKSKNKDMVEADARDKAHFVSNRAHGVYGKATQLAVGQGTGPGARLAQLLYTYQKFGHTYVQALYEAGVRKGNIKGFIYGLISPIILSGLAVVPFKDFWWKLIGIILNILGIKDDPEKGFWDWIRKKFGNTTERVGRHGLLGAANLDVSSSMSIGVGVPRDFYEMLGVGGGVLNDYIQAKHFLEIGNTSRAIEKALPTGIGNFFRAVRELNGATTLSGARVWDENGNPYVPNTGETAARVFGFRSAQLATMGERTWETKREIKSYSTEHNAILEAYRNYLVSKGSQEDFQEIMARIVKYNQNVISAGKVNEVPLIKYETLKRQAKQLTKPSKSMQAGLFQQ